jgi:A/G-specific adenine glycosylase
LEQKHLFSKKLMDWHARHPRALPWKEDNDPYRIWISEIILQQTRVAQGLPYYQRFIARFPDLESLARASEDELLQVWQGLGYYSRARNLLHTAKFIYHERKGTFPGNYRDLLQLKGVGPYTAAAIASFAFGEPRGVVDGNVIRVLARVFGIEAPFDTAGGKKAYTGLVDELLDPAAPAQFNQAIMDFGATHCTPRNPLCDTCPFSTDCIALKTGRVASLPVRSKSLQRKDRFFHYYVIRTAQGALLLTRRTENDIWKGLYQFPLLEITRAQYAQSRKMPLPDTLLSVINPKEEQPYGMIKKKQVLSHQNIHARFQIVESEADSTEITGKFFLVDYENLCNFAFPKIIDWFIAEKLIPL